MMFDLSQFVHHTACGALAAAGFGVLFNVNYRSLAGCAATGALALAVRTLALDLGWNLIAASFFAAVAVGFTVHLLQARVGESGNALAVSGCIPMIPGAFAAKAILGLFAVAAQHTDVSGTTLLTAVEFSLRALFTVGALGTGLAIPTLLPRLRSGR